MLMGSVVGIFLVALEVASWPRYPVIGFLLLVVLVVPFLSFRKLVADHESETAGLMAEHERLTKDAKEEMAKLRAGLERRAGIIDAERKCREEEHARRQEAQREIARLLARIRELGGTT